MSTRQPYPSDVIDDEWAFVAPYLSLLSPDALQRKHDLREVYNSLRWAAVYQQTHCWLRAGCFEAMAHDLRLLLRLAAGRTGQPSAVILDARTVQPTPESGAEADLDDGAMRRQLARQHSLMQVGAVLG